MGTKGCILVTGVTGYVGSWCAHVSLEEGYHVVGTVRDPASSKCQFLHDAIAGKRTKPEGSRHVSLSSKAKDNLTLVKADLMDGDDAWAALIGEHNVDYVMHTASPFFSKVPDDESLMIRPAVEGTESVLRACIKHKVKRVALTSSVAAVWEPTRNGDVLTDKNWSIAEDQDTYSKSKTLAERAAWKTMEGSDIELVTVQPGMIYGPTLYNDKKVALGFESGQFVTKLYNGGLPMVPKMNLGIVDVRDVARAHFAGLMTKEAAGKRVLCFPHVQLFKEVAGVFEKCVPKKQIKCRQLPNLAIHTYGKLTCAAEYKVIKGRIGIEWTGDMSTFTDVLGLTATPLDKTCKDMIEDLFEIGVISPPKSKK